MKYYIVETDERKTKYKIKTKDCISSLTLDLALSRYDIMQKGNTSGKKYFLIVDFGTGMTPLIGYTERDFKSGDIPFLILRQSGADNYPYNHMNNKLSIVQDGIEQEFNNKETAIRKFEWYLVNKISCNLVLSYEDFYDVDSKKFVEEDITSKNLCVHTHKICIASTDTLMNMKSRYMKRFIIE